MTPLEHHKVLYPTPMLFKYDEEYPLAYLFLNTFAFVAFVASVMAVGFAGSCYQVWPGLFSTLLTLF